MPDGDNVREKLARRYHRAYKKICEGKSDDETLVREVENPTIEQIKEYGDEAIGLLAEVVQICKDVRADIPLFRSQVNWLELKDKIEKAAQETCMDKRAKHLVLRACNEQVDKLRQGDNVNNIHIQMLQSYFEKIYRADFDAYIKSGLDHMYNAETSVVNETLVRIAPGVKEQCLSLAEKVHRDGTVMTLRQQKRHRGKNKGVPIDLNLLEV